MRRGTTPTLTLYVDADITAWEVYATINNGGNQLTFEDDRMTKTLEVGEESVVTKIEITLTQAETLGFTVGNAEVQIRAYNDGAAVATDIRTFEVARILLDGVIPNGE